jgi:serine/threonine protein phosphatase 1
MLVEILPINTQGRDFAVGDIHGAFFSVMRALDHANFDQSIDRLFLVGDIIDRGPASHQCAQFLSNKYVKAIRGNHEQYLIDLYTDGPAGKALLNYYTSQNINGMAWIRDMSEENMMDIVTAISNLPIVMETNTDRGTVGFVHADIPPGMTWETFKNKIQHNDRSTTQYALESRNRIESRNIDGVEGVGRVFVGHTVMPQGLKNFGNVFAIDTGACFGELYHPDDGHLTMVNIKMETKAMVSHKKATVFDLRTSDITPKSKFRST